MGKMKRLFTEGLPLAQTVVVVDEDLQTDVVYFNIYFNIEDDFKQYKVTDNFTFRSYDMTTIGECDFYNLTDLEIENIKMFSVEVL